MKNNKAFTIAEVLIVLGVLGIVAALTLPALMANVEKSQWMAGLRTSKSNVERAFTQMLAEYRADSLDTLPLWDGTIKAHEESSSKDAAKHELDKFFKIDKFGSNGSEYDVFNLKNVKQDVIPGFSLTLANNSVIYIDFKEASQKAECTDVLCEEFAEINIDVNGKKNPNTFGKDIYTYILSKEGRIFAYGSDEVNKLLGYPKWKDNNGCPGIRVENNWNSKACTARVAEDDYQIKYKY